MLHVTGNKHSKSTNENQISFKIILTDLIWLACVLVSQTNIFHGKCCTSDSMGSLCHTLLQTNHQHRLHYCDIPCGLHSRHNQGDAASCDCWILLFECHTVHKWRPPLHLSYPGTELIHKTKWFYFSKTKLRTYIKKIENTYISYISLILVQNFQYQFST